MLVYQFAEFLCKGRNILGQETEIQLIAGSLNFGDRISFLTNTQDLIDIAALNWFYMKAKMYGQFFKNTNS